MDSPDNEQHSSDPRPVKFYSDQYIFFFAKQLYKHKFKNWLGPVISNVHFEDRVPILKVFIVIFEKALLNKKKNIVKVLSN